MLGNAEAKSQGSASPRRADGRVGSAGAEGPPSLILSCTCKICAVYETPWQRSTSFNSSCTPRGPHSPPPPSHPLAPPSQLFLQALARDQNVTQTSRDTGRRQNKAPATCPAPPPHLPTTDQDRSHVGKLPSAISRWRGNVNGHDSLQLCIQITVLLPCGHVSTQLQRSGL